MHLFRATLPGNARDLERGRTLSMRAKMMAKYQRAIGACLAVVVFLACLCAYMMRAPKDDAATPIERVLRVHGTTPAVAHPPHDDIKFVGVILSATARVFQAETDVPPDFWAPCRRLSAVEMESDATLEGHKISDVLMTMCRIIHERVGCEGEGSLPAKLIDVDPGLNVCIATYKPPNGTCVHLVNPIVHKATNPSGDKIGFRHHHFPYAGKVLAEREPQILVTYHSPDDAYVQMTQGFGKNQSLFIQDAYDILMGAFPPPPRTVQ
jgi:hypothetical protein